MYSLRLRHLQRPAGQTQFSCYPLVLGSLIISLSLLNCLSLSTSLSSFIFASFDILPSPFISTGSDPILPCFSRRYILLSRLQLRC